MILMIKIFSIKIVIKINKKFKIKVLIILINSNIQEINHRIHQILVPILIIKINLNIQEINHRIVQILVQISLIIDMSQMGIRNKGRH